GVIIPLSHHPQTIRNPDQINRTLTTIIRLLSNRKEIHLQNKQDMSGWVFRGYRTLVLLITKIKDPLTGKRHFAIPPHARLRSAISPLNNENYCFMWTIYMAGYL